MFTKVDYYYKHNLALNDVPTDVTVGSKSGRFVPNLNFGKWNDEAWLNINYPIVVASQLATYDGIEDKIIISVGDYSFKWYLHSEESLEFEVVLGKKPPGNQSSFTFNLNFPDGLEFWYQPPLTSEEIAQGDVRPEKVVGSYAVYWNKSNNQYKTGKLCHIYRPRLTDAVGNQIWANLFIDPIAKTMTISIDPNWLKNANYPVVIDPEFGYHTIGGSTFASDAALKFHSAKSAPAGNGTTDNLYIYSSASNTLSMKVGLYTDSSGPNAPVSGSPVETTGVSSWTSQWKQFAMGGLSILSGANYWLTFQATQSLTVNYDVIGGTDRYWTTEAYAAAWPTPPTVDSTSGAKYSMYVDYTAAGGLSIPVAMANYRQRRIP